MTRSPRQGFTLYQLLLLFALLAILLGFLLPAIAKVRLAAKRMESQNNLKQIGLAVANYEGATGAIPPGNDANSYSAAAHLLPYIEQQQLWRQIDFTRPSDAKANAQWRAVRIKIYESPLDPVGRVHQKEGPISYFFNAGTQASLTNNTGIFYQGSGLTMAQLNNMDGTSNTNLLVESLKGAPKGGDLSAQRHHIALPAKALKGLKKDAGVADFRQAKNIADDRGASWMDGRFLQSTINYGLKVNDPRPDLNCAGQGGWAAVRSLGPTFNACFADGSVRSISVDVNPEMLRRAFHRMDGLVLILD